MNLIFTLLICYMHAQNSHEYVTFLPVWHIHTVNFWDFNRYEFFTNILFLDVWKYWTYLFTSMKNSGELCEFFIRVTDSYEFAEWHKCVCVTNLNAFVTRVTNMGALSHAWQIKMYSLQTSVYHAYIVVRSVHIPLKFRMYLSHALHLLICMFVKTWIRSCWHEKRLRKGTLYTIRVYL